MNHPPQQPAQGSYQGLGAFSEAPGKKRGVGRKVAIIAIVLLVLAGGGAATYFLTRNDDKPGNASSERSSGESTENTASDDDSSSPSDDASSDRDQGQGDDDQDAGNSPEDVRDDYMSAYESNDFSDVVTRSCKAYKTKFGTDTSDLETKLEEYEITATPDGEVDVDSENPDTATAKIDLVLVNTEETQDAKILIKIVEENGTWRFCGEDEA